MHSTVVCAIVWKIRVGGYGDSYVVSKVRHSDVGVPSSMSQHFFSQLNLRKFGADLPVLTDSILERLQWD